MTTDDAASILFFPKIISDAERDTFIQIGNRSNSISHADCFYIGGATQVQFQLSIGRQTATRWVVSKGREPRPEDPTSPGSVPALADGFTGALLCVETDPAGTPIGGNHLSGYATIGAVEGGNISEYAAVGLMGTDCAGDTPPTLILGGPPSTASFRSTRLPRGVGAGPSRRGCRGAADRGRIVGRDRRDDRALLVDLETQNPTTLTVDFEVINEFEQQFSASTTVTVWHDGPLGEISDIFDVATVGAASLQTRMTSPAGATAASSSLPRSFRGPAVPTRSRAPRA